MSLRVFHGGVDVLRRRGDEWDELLASRPLPDATRSAGWLAAWWQTFGAPRRGRSPAIVIVEEDGRMVGGAPMMLERLAGGPTVLRHLGRSPHWFDPTPLARPGREDAIAAIGAAIAGLPADFVVLEDLVAGSRELELLHRAMPGSRVCEQGETRHRYHADAPPNLHRRRREARRLVRRAEEAGLRIEIDVTAGRDAVLAQLDEAVDLVHRVWRRRGDASGVTGPAGRAYFHRALAALGPGAATMSSVRADGRLVAFHVAVHLGGLAGVFRGNWDPRGGVPGAGWMSMLRLVDTLSDRGIGVVDFAKFDWEYKRSITGPPHDPLASICLSRGFAGGLANAAWRARPGLLAVRDRARSVAPLRRPTPVGSRMTNEPPRPG